jgi:hypothetical protein
MNTVPARLSCVQLSFCQRVSQGKILTENAVAVLRNPVMQTRIVESLGHCKQTDGACQFEG